MTHCRAVLDVGCGTTNLITELRHEIPVFGIDASAAMLASGTGCGYVAAALAEHLAFGNQVFDGAISINLLEHVAEPGRALQEIARVLHGGGQVALATPAAEWSGLLDWAERWRLKLPEGPHRFLTRQELIQVAHNAGLQTVAYRRILILPFGGKHLACAVQFIEQWTPTIGFLHWLVAKRTS